MTETLQRAGTTSAAALDESDLQALRDGWAAAPSYRNAQNAVSNGSIDDVALNRRVVNTIDHTFSTQLDHWSATHQKQTGRCWIFAGLNLLRWAAGNKMDVEDFEFSQNYTMFCDKVERANYFFECILQTADRDVDDRLVAFLLDQPLRDAG